MEFGVIGISYKNVSLPLREQSSFSNSACISFYDEALFFGVIQVVIVSTCNRSEVYFIYENEEQRERMKTLYYAYTSQDNQLYLFEKYGQEAIQYMFEVCGGYHSSLLGEDQIIHQMKAAYKQSVALGACDKEMHKLWQSCFSSVKAMKHDRLQRHSISLPSLLLQTLAQTYDLKTCTMMIIGSGEMAQLLQTYAKSYGCKNIYICNRTRSHIHDFEGVSLVQFQDRYEAITRCDIICSATASPHTIIKYDQLLGTHKTQLFVDLALPRDIDESIANISTCTIWNMDDFKGCIDEHRAIRMKYMEEAHANLMQRANELYDWFVHHPIEKAIQTLTIRCHQSAAQTYALLNEKLTLSKREQYIVQQILSFSFHRMIKEPMMQLKQIQERDQQAYLQMLETLFQGDDERVVETGNKG